MKTGGISSATAHGCICREIDVLGNALKGIGSVDCSKMDNENHKLSRRIFKRINVLIDDLEEIDGTNNTTDV